MGSVGGGSERVQPFCRIDEKIFAAFPLANPIRWILLDEHSPFRFFNDTTRRMDRDWLETLVLIHQAELGRYLRYLGCRSDALIEDLLQDTFLAAFRSPGPRSQDEPLVAAWLRGIARNHFLAHCRKDRTARTTVTSDALDLAERVWVEELLASGDGFDYVSALRKCLTRLTDVKRRLLELRYTQRLSREQLAKTLAMSEDGIKSALRRVRGELADCVHHRLEAEQS
jgi:RNA polymerase sigma-70 factor, ECF subfamily